MLMTMLMSAAISCTFVGPPEFSEGGDIWCSSGAFSKVELQIDDEYTECEIDLTFSDEGAEVYAAKPEETVMTFAGIIEMYAKVGVDTKVRFHYDDEVLANCWADFEEGETVCTEGASD
jgi:hypothetical protein